MLSFQSFGGAAVTSLSNSQLGAAATQRRVLALVSLAAAGGTQGVTRDRAMGQLWPEADNDRARHALRQTLYHIRTSLQEPELFLPGNDVRLNPASIHVDTWEFDALIKAGRDADAISLYRGAFLDGFFLSGSSEFEDWASSQRRHFATVAEAALERLASAAEASNDWGSAVSWRRQQVGHDMMSSRATLKLMEALVHAGDSAAALQHADVHRRAVMTVLETVPDASIVAFEAKLRATSSRTPPPRVEVDDVSRDEVILELAQPQVRPESSWMATPTLRARLRRSRAAVGSAIVAVVGIAWFGSVLFAKPASTQKRIVVAPFRTSGAEQSLAYLHEGMVDLLAARFLDQSLTQAVDPGLTMIAWRKLGTKGSETDAENALRLAQRVGATGVIVGSVVGGPSRVYVTASLLGSPSGTRELEVSAEGPADSLTAVIDRLAAELLAARYGESDRLATRTTNSLTALRAYLLGQAAYRRGEYRQAGQQYDVALRADSQFALAAFQLALSFDRINDGEQHDRALAIAWENQSELSTRDRAHLIAFAGPDYPRPSSAADALAAWQSALNLTPVRADIWYEFGERLFRQGNPLGVDDAPRRAAQAFGRALALDPSDREGARPMLVLAAARMRDTATIRRYASPAAVRDSMGALSPFIRWTVARVFDDRQTLSHMRARFPQIDDENLRLVAMSSLYDGTLIADGERAANILNRRASASRELDALLAQHAFAMNAGDAFRALDVTEQIEERMPGVRAHLRLRVLDALYSTGNRSAATRAAELLERATANGPRGTELERAVFLSDLCVLEQWRIAHRDRAHTAASIEVLRARTIRLPVAIGTSPKACAALLEAWLAVDTRRPDARARLAAVDSLLLDGPVAGDAATYAHILLARLHRALGENDRALLAIQRHSYLTGWPRYMTTARRGESALTVASPKREIPGEATGEGRTIAPFSAAGPIGDSRSAVFRTWF